LKLYTKTGDDGSTGLIGATRVAKCDPRVAAYGDVDETNAALGVALSACVNEDVAEALRSIQSELFVLGCELATPPPNEPSQQIERIHIERLERWIDTASSATPPLHNFVLPGGCEEAVRVHLARTVCRRAERSVVLLAGSTKVRMEAIVYLNRLSDLLFAFARLANHRAGLPDVIWSAPKA